MELRYENGKAVFVSGNVYEDILFWHQSQASPPWQLKIAFINLLEEAYNKIGAPENPDAATASTSKDAEEDAESATGLTVRSVRFATASTPEVAGQGPKSPTGLTTGSAAASAQGDAQGGSSSKDSSPKKVGKGR